LEFTLHGKKLKGSWILVRTGRGASQNWLLIKRRDDTASEEDVVVTQPRSVLSKRLMAEIAFDEGGDVQRAAGADPEDAIRSLMRNPRTRKRVPRAKPAVWHSSRRS